MLTMPFLLILTLTEQFFGTSHFHQQSINDLLISFLKQKYFPTNIWLQSKELGVYIYFSTSFLWFERIRSEAEDKQESQMQCQIFVRCLKTVLHSEVFMKCPISGHTRVASHCQDRKLQDANDFSQMQGVALEPCFSCLLLQVHVFPILPSEGEQGVKEKREGRRGRL